MNDGLLSKIDASKRSVVDQQGTTSNQTHITHVDMLAFGQLGQEILDLQDRHVGFDIEHELVAQELNEHGGGRHYETSLRTHWQCTAVTRIT
jgi:hypothetical protein